MAAALFWEEWDSGEDMNFHLVVVRPFAAYGKGDVVTDAAAIREILAGQNAHNVVRVLVKEG
jgi:hypothetical protein